MKSEMDSMYINQVWNVGDIPPEGIKLIGCKWVIKRKNDMDDNIQTYTVRLVVKCYRQIQGVDFDETIFSLIIMLKAIKILLAIVAYYNYEI